MEPTNENKRNENIRERLLSRLPQPENFAAYREEVASTLAKQQKELSTHQWTSRLMGGIWMVLWFVATSPWGQSRGLLRNGRLAFSAGALFFAYMIDVLRVYMRKNQVELLKEVKQVQLQMLELQESLRKDGDL
jgi:hypothetical protein